MHASAASIISAIRPQLDAARITATGIERQEIWRDVDVTPIIRTSSSMRLYRVEVSNLGRIRVDDWVTTGSPISGGYRRVTVGYRDGRRIEVHVHRLVALGAYGPPPSGVCVRHLDGNPANNHPSNLKYGTPGENYADSVRMGRVLPGRVGNGRPRLSREERQQVVEEIRRGSMYRQIARRHSITVDTVCRIRRAAGLPRRRRESVQEVA